MSRVLILGSRGMLGQALIAEFDKGYSVVGLEKEDIDITDFSNTEKIILQHRPDILINAVAINIVDKIEENNVVFEQAKLVNGEAVGNLAKICKTLNIILVHYSSDYVFAGENKDGYDENSLIEPVNKYGETKVLGEKLVQDNCEKYYLIRLSKLFGKPASSVGAKKSFVDTMIWLATEGGKTQLDLVNEEISSPTYAPDLASLTRQLIESKKPYGIYHGANSGVCSWYEWGKKIFEIKKINIVIIPVGGKKIPRPARRPLYSQLLNTKLSVQRSWVEALKEYLN